MLGPGAPPLSPRLICSITALESLSERRVVSGGGGCCDGLVGETICGLGCSSLAAGSIVTSIVVGGGGWGAFVLSSTQTSAQCMAIDTTSPRVRSSSLPLVL